MTAFSVLLSCRLKINFLILSYLILEQTPYIYEEGRWWNLCPPVFSGGGGGGGSEPPVLPPLDLRLYLNVLNDSSVLEIRA